MHKLLGILFLSFLTTLVWSQSPAPDFDAPVSWPIQLSGTFGELRPGHFHMGIDIKSPDGGTGHDILAIDTGYISRIQISSGGYGKVLHIVHPSGHESVYAHLNAFTPEVDAYVKDVQYQKKSFEVDLMMFPDQFQIRKGEKIGELGMTGRTFGPHLHFEIRDKWTEVGLNPLLLGIHVNDNVAPRFYQIKVYEYDRDFRQLHAHELGIGISKSGYTTSPTEVTVHSDFIAIGIKAYDRMNGVRNLNGVFAFKMNVNGEPIFRCDFDTLSYQQQRYINAHKDFGEFVENDAYVNRMCILPGNALDIYTSDDQSGIIKVDDNEIKEIELVISDHLKNEQKLHFKLKKEDGPLPYSSGSFNHHIRHDQASTFQLGELQVDFNNGNVYQDVFAKITNNLDNATGNKIYHIHHKSEPVHRPYRISLHLPEIPDSLRTKTFVTGINSRDELTHYGGQWVGDTLTTLLYSFGDFSVGIDTLPPLIEAHTFQYDLSKATDFSIIIKDQFPKAPLSYEAFVDDQWILMDYDAKRDRLTHYFDDSIQSGEHMLRVIVSDRNGNRSEWSNKFIR